MRTWTTLSSLGGFVFAREIAWALSKAQSFNNHGGSAYIPGSAVGRQRMREKGDVAPGRGLGKDMHLMKFDGMEEQSSNILYLFFDF